jgi:hypothetical protein
MKHAKKTGDRMLAYGLPWSIDTVSDVTLLGVTPPQRKLPIRRQAVLDNPNWVFSFLSSSPCDMETKVFEKSNSTATEKP